MTAKNQFYSLQGNVRMAEYDSNNVLGKYWLVGSVDNFEFTMEEDTIEIKESITGNRSTAATIPNGLTAELNTTLKELNQENINALIRGKNATLATGSVTDVVQSLTFAEYTAGNVDLIMPSSHVNLTAVVVEGADASVITAGVASAAFGVITLPAGLLAPAFPVQVS
jgi:hypothetical protein